ncbi:MAG TPA: hypothetical protein VF892_10975 [Pseudonocardiaceae bacterium]
MPVRSDRGRNAAFRRLFTWPWRSPKHLAITSVVAAVAVVGVAAASNAVTSAAPAAAHASSLATQPATTPFAVSTTTPAVTSTTTAGVSTAVTPSSTAASITVSTPSSMVGDPVAAAGTFAAYWVQHTTDQAAWDATLKPLATDEWGNVVLPTIPPSSVTASTVTGTGRLVSNTSRSAQVTVPLNTGAITISLQDITGQGGWKVSDVQPAQG